MTVSTETVGKISRIVNAGSLYVDDQAERTRLMERVIKEELSRP